METFTEAYKAGLEASQSVDEYIEEINMVFENLKTEILSSTNGKIAIERGTALRRRRRTGLDIMLKPFEEQRIRYKAILAKNTESSVEIPLAEYTIDRKGYPVTIIWADIEESCLTKEGLTSTLEDLLSDPSTGKKLRKLLATKTPEPSKV